MYFLFFKAGMQKILRTLNILPNAFFQNFPKTNDNNPSLTIFYAFDGTEISMWITHTHKE